MAMNAKEKAKLKAALERAEALEEQCDHAGDRTDEMRRQRDQAHAELRKSQEEVRECQREIRDLQNQLRGEQMGATSVDMALNGARVPQFHTDNRTGDVRHIPTAERVAIYVAHKGPMGGGGLL